MGVSESQADPPFLISGGAHLPGEPLIVLSPLPGMVSLSAPSIPRWLGPTLKENSSLTRNGKLTACRMRFSFRVCSICFSFTT